MEVFIIADTLESLTIQRYLGAQLTDDGSTVLVVTGPQSQKAYRAGQWAYSLDEAYAMLAKQLPVQTKHIRAQLARAKDCKLALETRKLTVADSE